MTKKRIALKSGDILQIPLSEEGGYAYAKYLNIRKLANASSFEDMIKVFDYKTNNQDFDIFNLESCEYLVQPILVAGLIRTLKDSIWQVVGYTDIKEDDYVIPHFKFTRDDMSDAVNWYFVEDVSTSLSSLKKASYEDIKHLELYAGRGTGNIEIRLAMYFLLKEGKHIDNYFDLENESYKWQYKEVEEIPLLSSLPKELRGKVKSSLISDSSVNPSLTVGTASYNNLKITITSDGLLQKDLLALRSTLVDTLEDRNLGKVWDENISTNSIQVQLEVEEGFDYEEQVKAILRSLGILGSSQIKLEASEQ